MHIIGQSIPIKPPPGSVVNWLHPMSRGLVGAWLMNEGAGSQVFDMAAGNHGRLTNMVPWEDWVSGRFGHALDFDGTNDYVSVTHNRLLNVEKGPFTISAWIYPRTGATADAASVISKKDTGGEFEGYAIRFPSATAANKIDIHLNNSAEAWRESSGTVTLNVWNHIAWAYNGATSNIYINGKFDVARTMAPPTAAVTSNLELGRSTWDTPQIFDGRMDDVRIYNRVLTPGEILELYLNPFGFVAHWRRRVTIAAAAANAAWFFQQQIMRKRRHG